MKDQEFTFIKKPNKLGKDKQDETDQLRSDLSRITYA